MALHTETYEAHFMCFIFIFGYPNVHQGAGLKPFGRGPLPGPCRLYSSPVWPQSEPRLSLWLFHPRCCKVTALPKQQAVDVSNYLSEALCSGKDCSWAGVGRGFWWWSGQREPADVAEGVATHLLKDHRCPWPLTPERQISTDGVSFFLTIS